MTRSVEEYRRQSEISRAEFSETVDELRSRFSNVRDKVSPSGLKAEVSERARDWVDALRSRAQANPMQTFAIGVALTVPALRMIRSIPLPLLVIGAGCALASDPLKARLKDAAAPAVDKANELAEGASGYASSMRDAAEQSATLVRDNLADAGSRARDTATALRETALGFSQKVNTGASETAEAARQGAERLKVGASDLAAKAPAAAADIIGKNAPLIGIFGLAIGAVLAAALPSSEVENLTLGKTAMKTKRVAADALDHGLEVAGRTADAAAERIKSELDSGLSRATRTAGETLRSVTEEAITTAFEPSEGNQR